MIKMKMKENKNMWILLDEGLYLFGPGGVTRIEPVFDWDDGKKVSVGVELFNERKSVAITSTSLMRITELIMRSPT